MLLQAYLSSKGIQILNTSESKTSKHTNKQTNPFNHDITSLTPHSLTPHSLTPSLLTPLSTTLHNPPKLTAVSIMMTATSSVVSDMTTEVLAASSMLWKTEKEGSSMNFSGMTMT